MSRKKVKAPVEEKKPAVKTPVQVPAKTVVKHPAQKEAEPKKETAMPVAEAVTNPVTDTGAKVKKPWDGIGLVGNNEQLNIFKGKIKMKGKILGEVLYGMIEKWNKEN